MKLKYIILSITIPILIGIVIVIHYKSFDPWVGDEDKIAQIVKYFDSDPLIGNGASGFTSVNFSNEESILNNIKYDDYQYAEVFKNSHYLGKKQFGNIKRYYFERYTTYIIIEYVKSDNFVGGDGRFTGFTRGYLIRKFRVMA